MQAHQPFIYSSSVEQEADGSTEQHCVNETRPGPQQAGSPLIGAPPPQPSLHIPPHHPAVTTNLLPVNSAGLHAWCACNRELHLCTFGSRYDSGRGRPSHCLPHQRDSGSRCCRKSCHRAQRAARSMPSRYVRLPRFPGSAQRTNVGSTQPGV